MMNKAFHYTLFVTLALAISSCASINSTSDNSTLVSKNDYHRGENQSITIAQPTEKEQKKDKDKDKKKDKKDKKGKNEKNDKVVKSTNTVKNSTLTMDELQGEWVLYSMFSQTINDDERPYFIFDGNNLYANDGCNTINANVEIDNNNPFIIFSNALKTQRYCTSEEAPYEYNIAEALNNAKSHAITIEGNEHYLHFKTANGANMMTIKKINLNFLNGIWKINKINGDSGKCKNKDLKMALDIDERNIHAKLVCNTVNGKLLIDNNKQNSITFLDLASTRMMCKEPELEQEILIALESVDHYKKDGNKKIILYDKNNNALLELSNESEKLMNNR